MKTIVKMPTTGVEYSIPKVPEEVSKRENGFLFYRNSKRSKVERKKEKKKQKKCVAIPYFRVKLSNCKI